MFKIKGYNLQSFAIGSKHVRAFSLDNCSGIITDYVLAECGAEKSPFPAEFYKRVSSGEGAIKLHNADDTASYLVTRDNIVLSQRTASIEEDIEELGVILEQANHIIPGTLAFMNNPKAKLLGMVWQFTEEQTAKRERFNHPIAQDYYKRLLKLDLQSKEHPSETNVHLAFRKKLPSGYLMKEQNDFLNIIINIGDRLINDLWPDTEDIKPRTQIIEDTRVGFVSIDIQLFFDPRRKISNKTIEAHWKECHKLKARILELLKGVGFETKE